MKNHYKGKLLFSKKPVNPIDIFERVFRLYEIDYKSPREL